MTGSAAVAGIQRAMDLDDDFSSDATSMRATYDEDVGNVRTDMPEAISVGRKGAKRCSVARQKRIPVLKAASRAGSSESGCD